MTQEEKNKMILDGWSKERLAEEWVREHIKYNELKQENEELKELCNKYEEEHNTTFKEWLDIIEEHNIMKQLIIENGLWERLLNDDRFLKHLRSDNNEYNK